MPEPPRADRISVELLQAGSDVAFRYRIDDRGAAELGVRYPFPLGAGARDMLPAIGVGVATYLGQLCLARDIAIEFPADPALAAAIAPIAQMLYDIRCWKDARELVEPPRLRFAQPVRVSPCDAALAQDDAVLLFSGGKDSALAAIALARNGLRVRTLHVSANVAAADAEAAATQRLLAQLRLPAMTLAYRHPEYRALARRHAREWDVFPHWNSVPFGRDLVLALIALPVLVHNGSGVLSFGHDGDCRAASVSHCGRTIPRNDVESATGAEALERYIRTFALPQMRLLPPLAGLSEHRILREMFEQHADLMGETSFCFWGRNCGRCAKCLRYFLAQRLFRREGMLAFAHNPLGQGACPELGDVLDSWGHERLLFALEIVYALGRLVERGDLRPDEDLLVRFRDTIYPSVAERLDEWEVGLCELRPDPQVPSWFRPVQESSPRP